MSEKAGGATPRPWRLRTTGNMGSLIEAHSGKHMNELDDGYRTVASFQECCASDLYTVQEANRIANGNFIVEAVNSYDAAQERIRELERALQPFAEIAKEFTGQLSDDRKNTMHWAVPTVGQFRAALRALSTARPIPEKEERK